jgi:DNA-directed RNA polymerase subunit F
LWKWTLTDEEKAQIEHLRATSRVAPEQIERLADRVLVKRWFVENRRLIYRVITIFPDGEVRNEDAVIGENLPVNG